MASGRIPLCSTAHIAPVRPTPVCTSSTISGMPRSAVIRRISRSQPSGAGTTPPSPCTASRIIAAGLTTPPAGSSSSRSVYVTASSAPAVPPTPNGQR